MLFGRRRRDFSHGCIRLQDARGLAWFLLRDRAEWPPDRMEAAAAADSPTVVPLGHPVPVELVYWTVTTGPGDSVAFLRDIYGHDHTLDSLMRLRYPLPR